MPLLSIAGQRIASLLQLDGLLPTEENKQTDKKLFYISRCLHLSPPAPQNKVCNYDLRLVRKILLGD